MADDRNLTCSFDTFQGLERKKLWGGEGMNLVSLLVLWEPVQKCKSSGLVNEEYPVKGGNIQLNPVKAPGTYIFSRSSVQQNALHNICKLLLEHPDQQVWSSNSGLPLLLLSSLSGFTPVVSLTISRSLLWSLHSPVGQLHQVSHYRLFSCSDFIETLERAIPQSSVL